MKEVCFFTVYDKVYKDIGDMCVRSIEHFYPEVDVFAIDIKREGGFDLKAFCDLHLKKGRELLDVYKRVISVDADSIMCNYCPELFDFMDMGLVKNNIDFYHDKWSFYLNAGLVVCTSPDLWDAWTAKYLHLCGEKWDEFNEQNALNELYHENFNYNMRLLEFPDKAYGITSQQYYPKMYLKDHELYVNYKKLCIAHFAGRDWITEEVSAKKKERLKFDLIEDPVASNKLQKLTT